MAIRIESHGAEPYVHWSSARRPEEAFDGPCDCDRALDWIRQMRYISRMEPSEKKDPPSQPDTKPEKAPIVDPPQPGAEPKPAEIWEPPDPG